MITDEVIAECVKEQVRLALPNHVLRGIARNILRKQLAEPTLEEAARLLKWRSAIALRRALERFGVELTKTSPRIVTVPMAELRRFQMAHRVRIGKRQRDVASRIAAFRPVRAAHAGERDAA